ncbi:MAG: SAM-dependent methyltransferase [Desulfobacca sp.]|nr:SAM-dependent methyltransferase [Desulfobacca sp.]
MQSQRHFFIIILLAALVGLGQGFPALADPPPVPGKFFLVGLGPAGPEHTTLKALETIKKADLILAYPELIEPFQAYLAGKKIYDPWKELWFSPDERKLQPEARRARLAEKTRQRDKFVKEMLDLLAQGKNVALLTGGDPTVYSRAFWLLEGIPEDQVEVIPGLGAVSAAMAALKRASTGAQARFVLQTSPRSFFGQPDHDDLVRELSQYSGTLVFYMGLKNFDNLVNTLKKYYPANLPIAVVYYAGHPTKEKVIQGTLTDILPQVGSEREKWWGLVIVGHCLTGPSFTPGE